ncbi:hypothetical protein LUZ60_011787 [Juncus effusus]|nr:hypothetical protein LUZ60_011787 [Juncus effusus]
MSDSAASTAAPPVSDPAADRAVSFSSQPLSIKLDRENFLLWKSQVPPVIHGRNLLGLLTGSDPAPPKTNPEYLLWRRRDELLRRWLLASLSEAILPQFIDCETSADLWAAVQKVFSCSSNSLAPLNHKVTKNVMPLYRSKTLKGSRDWARQLDDVLGLIMDRLWFLPHLRKFAICCKNWYLFAKERLQTFDADAPLLLLPYNETTNTLSFFNLEKSEIHNLNISELGPPCWIYGSSNGWLGVINNNLDLELLNPLTRASVPLPRLDSVTIEKYLEMSSDYKPSYARDSYVKKVTIMEDSTSPLNFLVAIIFSAEQTLGLCRLADKEWTVLSARIKPPPGEIEYHRSFKDVIFYNGKVYALETYSVKVFDYFGPGNVRATTSIKIPGRNEEYGVSTSYGSYLVMSCGNLLYVQRYGEYCLPIYGGWNEPLKLAMTKYFKVYRLGSDKETWIRVYSLEGESLFVGSNDSVSVSTKERPWLKPDCIYFMDDLHLPDEFKPSRFELDNGVFSLKENCVVERFDIKDSDSVWPMPAMWYQQKI